MTHLSFPGVLNVIDPRRDVDVYLQMADKLGLTITHPIETHIHADFVSGARELAARSGTAKVAASVEGDPRYGFSVDRKRRDGDELAIGSIRLTAIHTPGHTPEHMSFLATSEDQKPWALFTGDFLFVGSVGRPDLMGVENTDSLAKALYRSVQDAFADLPGELMIYPAHGPGSPCGAGIKAPEGDPTLAKERQGNPYWRMKPEAVFIEALLNAQPPVPYYWPRMKEINAAGPEALGKTPAPRLLDPQAFSKFIETDGVQLLDTRLMHAYAGGQVTGAINIGYNEAMSLWAGWLLDPTRTIALIKPAEGNFADPVDWLSRVGLVNVEAALDGDFGAWANAGRPFESFRTMSVHEVRKTFPTEKMTLLDVRQPSEWDMGHELIELRRESFPEDEEVKAVVDEVPVASRSASAMSQPLIDELRNEHQVDRAGALRLYRTRERAPAKHHHQWPAARPGQVLHARGRGPQRLAGGSDPPRETMPSGPAVACNDPRRGSQLPRQAARRVHSPNGSATDSLCRTSGCRALAILGRHQETKRAS